MNRKANLHNAPVKIKALAQEDGLQIFKSLEAHAAPDAVVSDSQNQPDVQNPQNKLLMSEPAPHTPGVQDPQNKWPIPGPAIH